MRFLRQAYERFADLLHELAKFGTVGAFAFVIDVGGFNLLQYGLQWGTLTSKVVATAVATTFAYVGNRFWTYRHREQSGLTREYFLFFLLNGVALLIGLLVVGFTRYTLGLTDPVSINVANLFGIGLGTLFRFFSYKKWVFLAATEDLDVPRELPKTENTRPRRVTRGR
ncbi:GtrA family protein [Planomonospora sp. ID82291]|uniref:GtrA family protein n=1 Tax=Planomonospora sp. ID82291 TaxID=2738136 RepID=UPI0018C37779|nr:GtrA family protein [Planomonospora sp. ID82291]MBG0813392.1 GtrA family protein [Planomonospora sp. ID82291]